MELIRLREQEELDEAVQTLISIAASQPSFSNEFSLCSSQALLAIVSGGPTEISSRRACISERQSVEATTQSPQTVLMVQRRLNAEFRHLVSTMRDSHEARLESERRKYDANEAALRAVHSDNLKRIAAQHVAVVDDAALPHVKAPSAAAVEVLERKLTEQHRATRESTKGADSASSGGGDSAAAGVDPSTKKVVAFWKAKYRTLAKQLEEILSDIASTEAKCSQLVDLRGASHDTLEQMLLTLRDAEYREKSRLEELRSQYVDACKRRGIVPHEPSIDGRSMDVAYDPQSGRVRTKAELQRASGSGGTFQGHRPSTSSGSGSGSGSSQLYATLIREQKLKNRETALTAEQLEARVRKLMVDGDAALEAFAVKAGAYRGNGGGGAALLEEVIGLLAESDQLDNSIQEVELQGLKAEVDHATEARELQETFETQRLAMLTDIEGRKEELRELELQLTCYSKRTSDGACADDGIGRHILEDQAAVLASKIAIVENEIAVIRQEREALMKVGKTLEDQVARVIQEREARAAASGSP